MNNRILRWLIALVAIMVLVGSAWPQGLGVSKAQTNLSEEQIFTGDIVAPSPRDDHAMAYDAARQRVVLFGGRTTGRLLGDIWEWDGESWTQKFPVSSPSARAQHAMVYDAARQRVVLFGGYSDPSREFHDLNDTWEWDGVNWRRKSPTNSPPARAEHALAYDGVRQRVVLFGGSSFNDTWEWDGTTWTQKFPSLSPSARLAHAMVYDTARQRVVLFGGDRGGRPWLTDTWEWDGLTWTQKHPAVSPPGLNDSGMAYDPARSRVVLFGGDYQVGSNATWEWNGTTWVQMSPTVSPPARYQLAAAFDGHQVVIFGGSDGRNYLDDTWKWDGRAWVRVGFRMLIVSDLSTEYLSGSGWVPAVLAYVNPAWPSLPGARWIWKSYLVTPDEALHGTSTVTFRRRFTLPSGAQNATGTIQITADNAYELSINGVIVGRDGVLDPSGTDFGWRAIETYPFTGRPGENEITIRALSYQSSSSDPRQNTAGVLFQAEITEEEPAALEFGYVGAIQSVRGAPLIVEKETAIEVDVVKRGGPAVQGVRVSVNANGTLRSTFYVKEQASAATGWRLTELYNSLNLPEGDWQGTLYFFAPDRRLIPASRGSGSYMVEAKVYLGQNPEPLNSKLAVQEILDPQWGDDPAFKILCIPADWELLGREKGNRITKAAADTKELFQSCFPIADAGSTRLIVATEKTEESSKDKPSWWPFSWPDARGQLGELRLLAWVVDQHAKWSKRANPVDRWVFLVPEGWFAQRVGPPLGTLWGSDHDFRPNVPVAEVREKFPIAAGYVPYTGMTPGWLIGHELAHSFGLDEDHLMAPIHNALDVPNRRVESHLGIWRWVVNLLWNDRVSLADWSDDRWLLAGDYTRIAQGLIVATSANIAASTNERRAILITAVLRDSGEVNLLPWYVLNEAEADISQMPEGEEFFLEYLNGAGQVVYSRGFPDLFDLRGQHVEIMPLSLVGPYFDGVRAIRLRRAGSVLFNRAVSANPPTVQITIPISGTVLTSEVGVAWNTVDTDGDSTFCSLTAYKEGTEEIWPLADDLDGNSYRWNTEKLSPGWYRLEALVTDGVNTAKSSVTVLKIQKTYLPLVLRPPRPTPTPTVTPTPTATPTRTLTPTPTVTPIPTATPTMGSATIWGRCLRDGNPMAGVEISIGSGDGSSTWEPKSRTNNEGYFHFFGVQVPPGGTTYGLWPTNHPYCRQSVHVNDRDYVGPLIFNFDAGGRCH